MFTWFLGLFWIAGFVKTVFFLGPQIYQTSHGISFYIISLMAAIYSQYISNIYLTCQLGKPGF